MPARDRMHFVNAAIALTIILTGYYVTAKEFKLLLIHNNDLHAKFFGIKENGVDCGPEEPNGTECFGGFARMKRAVDEARLEADRAGVPSLFLNAGDSFQGSSYFVILKWRIVADMLLPFGIDVMSLGNHEFDDGLSGLVPFLKNITIPVVSANVNVTATPELQLPILTKSKVLMVEGRKIGVVGYLTPSTMDIALADNLVIDDEIDSIRQEAVRLKGDGVDMIIALGHSGYDMDLLIAEQIPEVSVVVGGHSHSLLYTPKDHPPSTDPAVSNYPHIVTQKSGKMVPVVQAGCFTKYLGKLWLSFNDEGDVVSAVGNTQLLNSSVTEDESMLKRLAKWKTMVDEQVNEVLTVSKVFLEGSDPNCRYRECNLGNLVADSFVDYVAGRSISSNSSWSSASIAIVQGGSLRSNLNNGNITYGSLISFLPFDNKLFKVTLAGETIKKALEHSVHRYSVWGQSEFLQMSGLHVTYDIRKPPWQRLISARARCDRCSVPQYFPLQDENDYDVVISEYLFQGKDGFDMIKEEKKNYSYIGISDKEAVYHYLKRETFIYPELEERIMIMPDVVSNAIRSFFSLYLTLICSVVLPIFLRVYG